MHGRQGGHGAGGAHQARGIRGGPAERFGPGSAAISGNFRCRAATFSGAGGSPRGRAWLRVRTPRGRLANLGSCPGRTRANSELPPPTSKTRTGVCKYLGPGRKAPPGGTGGPPPPGPGPGRRGPAPPGAASRKAAPLPGGPHRVGGHRPVTLHLIIRHHLTKNLEGLEGPGHALRGQVPGLGQPLAQAGDLPAVQQDAEAARGALSAMARRTVRLPRSRAAKRAGLNEDGHGLRRSYAVLRGGSTRLSRKSVRDSQRLAAQDRPTTSAKYC